MPVLEAHKGSYISVSRVYFSYPRPPTQFSVYLAPRVRHTLISPSLQALPELTDRACSRSLTSISQFGLLEVTCSRSLTGPLPEGISSYPAVLGVDLHE